MSFKTAQISIEKKFATGFTACRISYQNVDFKSDLYETFAELQIADGEALRKTIGPNPLIRSTGVISVNIYTPRNIGSVTGRALADMAAAVFRDAVFDSITCRSPVVRNVGSLNGRYVVNMTVGFFRDEQF